MTTRRNERAQIAILMLACAVAIFGPSIQSYAQSQEAVNATFTEQMKGMALRIEHIESLVNAVIFALLANFLAHIVQIARLPDRRK